MTPLLHALVDVTLVTVLGLVAVVPGSWLVTWVFRRVDREDVSRRLSDAGHQDRGPMPQGGTGRIPGDPDTASPPTGTPGTDEPPAAASQDARTLQGAGAVLRGGRWIGRLERLAVFASIVAGYPNGLAVGVAVKALARYPELRSTTSAAAERFIIGTFVSVLWAVAWAGLARWALTLY